MPSYVTRNRRIPTKFHSIPNLVVKTHATNSVYKLIHCSELLVKTERTNCPRLGSNHRLSILLLRKVVIIPTLVIEALRTQYNSKIFFISTNISWSKVKFKFNCFLMQIKLQADQAEN